MAFCCCSWFLLRNSTYPMYVYVGLFAFLTFCLVSFHISVFTKNSQAFFPQQLDNGSRWLSRNVECERVFRKKRVFRDLKIVACKQITATAAKKCENFEAEWSKMPFGYVWRYASTFYHCHNDFGLKITHTHIVKLVKFCRNPFQSFHTICTMHRQCDKVSYEWGTIASNKDISHTRLKPNHMYMLA